MVKAFLRNLLLAGLFVASTAGASPLRGLVEDESESRSGRLLTGANDTSSSVPWAIQSGPANGHSDAGGMIYDYRNDEIILVGTTHDDLFFQDDEGGADSVDCFIVTIPLSSSTITESADLTNLTAMAKSTEETDWGRIVSGKKRVTTRDTLDRCDLLAGSPANGLLFSVGTLAARVNDQDQVLAASTFLFEIDATNTSDDTSSTIRTGPALDLEFQPPPVDSNLPLVLVNNDIIIPTAVAVDDEDGSIYVATLHRLLALSQASSDVVSLFRIGLGISKHNSALLEVWKRIYRTSIYEVRGDDVPFVTSGMFDSEPGLEPVQERQQGADVDTSYHYSNDGVLISGLEIIHAQEPYLLIAGSAPEGNDYHPFLRDKTTPASSPAGFDGFIAKVEATTGGTNAFDSRTWSFRFNTQPGRDDFLQSICVPRLAPGVMTSQEEPYHPSVVYAIGTTNGRYDGRGQDGGAVVLQLDLETMNINWKKQLPGLEVQGLACQVLVDPDTISAPRTTSRDLLYVAGEVSGNMTVELDYGTSVETQGQGETDVWVTQMNARDGSVRWVQQVGSPLDERLGKNVNNPSSGMDGRASGKGALVLDSRGNAIVYGTTSGSFAREKDVGDSYRDIFVLQFNKDDGDFEAAAVDPAVAVATSRTRRSDSDAPF